MKKLIYTTLGLLGATVGYGLYFTSRVSHIKRKDEQTIMERERKLNHFDPVKFNQLPKKEVSIASPNGYFIKAIIIKPFPEKKFMIFSHGVTENKMSSIKYMNVFLQRGFNAVIYDQRRHGESGGKTTSYGYYEKFDLKAIVDWLYQEEGDDLLLGIHGESMGAATLLLYAGELESRAHFYIADCPFSDLKELLTYRMKCEAKYLPTSLCIPIGNLFLKLRDHYRMEDVSPISVVERINEPVLFIHSKKDDYILPSMTEALYRKKPEPKMLFLAENGAHAQSLNENKEEYEKAIDQFLNQYVFLHHKA